MLTQNNRVSTKFEKSIPVVNVNVMITQTIEWFDLGFIDIQNKQLRTFYLKSYCCCLNVSTMQDIRIHFAYRRYPTTISILTVRWYMIEYTSQKINQLQCSFI